MRRSLFHFGVGAFRLILLLEVVGSERNGSYLGSSRHDSRRISRAFNVGIWPKAPFSDGARCLSYQDIDSDTLLWEPWWEKT